MAARGSFKSVKKKVKYERSQYHVKILTRACKNTNTALAFILSQSKKSDESRQYKGHVCQGFLNGVSVGEGFDDNKGKEAKDDCAKQIIESILCKKIAVEKRVFENLFALVPPERMETEPPYTATPHHDDWGSSTRHRSPLNRTGAEVQKAITKEWQLKLSANIQSKDNKAIKKDIKVTKKDEGVQGTVSAGQNPQPFATNRQPKIPESNIGCQMLRKMGWTGGGLGTEERKGIEEPIVVNPVHERHGIGMPHDYQPSTSKYKWNKHEVQPIITHKFIQKFKNSGQHEIVITEPLMREDYGPLRKLCDKNRLLYEFVPPFNHLVIRKPTTWESSKTGQAITRDKKRNIERQISQIRKETSHLYTKQTHPSTTASSLKGFEGASHLPIDELLCNVVIKQEPLCNPTTTKLVRTTRHPTTAITTAFDPLDPRLLSTTREIVEPSYNMTMTQESLERTLTSTTENVITNGYPHDTGSARGEDQHLLNISDSASFEQGLLHSAMTKNVNTCHPLAEDGCHTFRGPTNAELLDAWHEFGLGDDIKEIFFSFLNSNEVELEITRNLTSKERLTLYRISDVYGFHFMLFSHNKHDKSIVIRKS